MKTFTIKLTSEYLTKECLSYYCRLCNSNQVKSDDSSTGEFFSIAGHEDTRISCPSAYHRGSIDGNWIGVFFAYCTECLLTMAKKD